MKFGLHRKEDREVLVDPMKLTLWQERQEALNWANGRSQDPMRILMRLEDRADRAYDVVVERRLPTKSRSDFRRAYINRCLLNRTY